MGIEDWEKVAIMQVLRRNNTVKMTEDRRLRQLQVRLQIEPLSKDDWVKAEQSMIKKTGHWYRQLWKRNGNNNGNGFEQNTAQKIYQQLNYELASSSASSSRRPSDTEGNSPSTSLFPSSSSTSKRKSIEAWLKDADKYNDQSTTQPTENEQSKPTEIEN